MVSLDTCGGSGAARRESDHVKPPQRRNSARISFGVRKGTIGPPTLNLCSYPEGPVTRCSWSCCSRQLRDLTERSAQGVRSSLTKTRCHELFDEGDCACGDGRKALPRRVTYTRVA